MFTKKEYERALRLNRNYVTALMPNTLVLEALTVLEAFDIKNSVLTWAID